jgi:hypothetical protein
MLSATQAIALLEHLRADDSSQQDGVVVGQPATRLVVGEPEQEPETVLVNQMRLSPSRAKLLLRLLEKHEAQLRETSEEEQKERRRRLWGAYRLVPNLADRAKAQGEPEAPGEVGGNA